MLPLLSAHTKLTVLVDSLNLVLLTGIENDCQRVCIALTGLAASLFGSMLQIVKQG